MIDRNIITFPSPILTSKALDVTTFDSNLKTLVVDMKRLMRNLKGIGIAGPQVGDNRRVIIVSVTHPGDVVSYDRVLINPRIVWKSDDVTIDTEGCLSLPEQTCLVSRSLSVEVNYSDETGRSHRSLFSGLVARVVQHEVDHLDGVLMVTRALQKPQDTLGAVSMVYQGASI